MNDEVSPEDQEAKPSPSDLVRNERTKLVAGFLNTLATTCFGAGAITPIALLVFGTAPQHRVLWIWGVGMLIFMLISVALHRLAVAHLGRLKG